MARVPGRPAGRRVVVSDLGLQRGSVELRSAGPITFGPDGVLFVADNASATIHAIDVGDAGEASGAEPFDLEHVDERVASYLGADGGRRRDQRSRRAPGDAPGVPVGPARARRRRPCGAAPHRRRRRVGERGRPRRRPDRVGEARRRARRADERSDVTLPTDGSGEELTFGDRTIRILKRPIRMATVTDLACTGRMRCSWPGSRTRSSRRSCAASRFPFGTRRRGQQPRDLPRVARASGRRPHRSARSFPTTVDGASWPATRARRSCTSHSTTSSPTRRSSAAPSPSSAR